MEVEREMHGFVTTGTSAVPPVPIDDVTRERLLKVCAAMIVGETPDEITECLADDEWPESVDLMLSREYERPELVRHVDVLLSVLQGSAKTPATGVAG